MPGYTELSSNQLRQALQIREQMDHLEQRFDSLFSGGGTAGGGARATSALTNRGGRAGGIGGRRKMSAEARARIAAAQRARWANSKKGTAKAAATKASSKALAQPKKA